MGVDLGVDLGMEWNDWAKNGLHLHLETRIYWHPSTTDHNIGCDTSLTLETVTSLTLDFKLANEISGRICKAAVNVSGIMWYRPNKLINISSATNQHNFSPVYRETQKLFFCMASTPKPASFESRVSLALSPVLFVIIRYMPEKPWEIPNNPFTL